MKRTLIVALAASCAALVGPVLSPGFAQQGTPVSREAAQALYAEINAVCANGPINGKACGVLVYSPEDCNQEKDPHARKVFNTYADGTIRFEQGTQVARNRPGALLVGFGIFNRKGETTKYANPVFLSWDAYSGGKKTMPVCGKDARIVVKDFEITKQVDAFLKANPG